MGLIISKQIIKTNGGKLDFYSEYGVGSTTIFTFDIELPHDVISNTERE